MPFDWSAYRTMAETLKKNVDKQQFPLKRETRGSECAVCVPH